MRAESTPMASSPNRRKVLLLATALPVIAAGCSTTQATSPAQPVLETPPRPLAGTRWQYRQVNRYNGETVRDVLTEVVAGGPGLTIRQTDGHGLHLNDEVYASAWHVINEPFYDRPIEFEQAVPMLPASLNQPRRATFNTRHRPIGEQQWLTWSVRTRIKGWHTIEVPAGRFECLCIERDIQYDVSNPFRHDARRTETLWYAPKVGRWVRRDWSGSYIDEAYVSQRRFGALFSNRTLEDSVRWELLTHQAAPVA